MRHRWRKTLAIGLALALFISVACTPRDSAAPESPPAGWPESLHDFTVTWTAEPDINLTVSAAVVVRAYLESYYLAYLTADNKYLYPGIEQAANTNQPDGPDWTEELWPEPSRPKTWAGTARHHILRIDQSGRQFSVVASLYSDGSAGAHEGRICSQHRRDGSGCGSKRDPDRIASARNQWTRERHHGNKNDC